MFPKWLSGRANGLRIHEVLSKTSRARKLVSGKFDLGQIRKRNFYLAIYLAIEISRQLFLSFPNQCVYVYEYMCEHWKIHRNTCSPASSRLQRRSTENNPAWGSVSLPAALWFRLSSPRWERTLSILWSVEGLTVSCALCSLHQPVTTA